MGRKNLPEKRKVSRRGLAVRVVLRDHRPPMHAITRDISLHGMQLISATRVLTTGRRCTAEIEIDRRDQRWTLPIPVNVVWSDKTVAGVEFEQLPAEIAADLENLIDQARARASGARFAYNQTHYATAAETRGDA